MAKLIEKSTDQLLSALEDHLYLVHKTVTDLAAGDAAHMRQLVGQLRGLVCKSNGLTGLLWRLCDEIPIDDTVHVRYPGKIDLSALLAKDLYYAGVPVAADGSGASGVLPKKIPFKRYIQECEAVFIDGESISHEHLISRLANETGTAHEADGVSRWIAKLNSVQIGDVPSYFTMVDEDARLTLQIGERVIQTAVAQGYRRRRPTLGNLPGTRLENTRFNFKTDVPQLASQSKGKTALFILGLSNVPKIGKLEKPIIYPPFTVDTFSFMPTISRRRKVKISTTGLPIFNFSFEFDLPESLPNSIDIIITWEGYLIKAFANGRQVAGPREHH